MRKYSDDVLVEFTVILGDISPEDLSAALFRKSDARNCRARGRMTCTRKKKKLEEMLLGTPVY